MRLQSYKLLQRMIKRNHLPRLLVRFWGEEYELLEEGIKQYFKEPLKVKVMWSSPLATKVKIGSLTVKIYN